MSEPADRPKTNEASKNPEEDAARPEFVENQDLGKVEHVLHQFAAAIRVGNPILDKVTSAHIGKLVEGNERDSERSHTRSLTRYKYVLIGTIGFFGFILLLCWLFLHYGIVEYIDDIIKAFALFGGGFGIGYGTGRSSRKIDQ